MRLTHRLTLLLLLGVIPAFFIGRVHWLMWLICGYDALLLLFVAVDLLLTPKKAFEVERIVDDKLSLGVNNKVTLAARYVIGSGNSYGLMPRRITVRDEPPLSFECDRATTFTFSLSAAVRDASDDYHVKPPSKGDFTFGDIYVMYEGYFGLVSRVEKIASQQAIKVYPNLVDTEKYDLLARSGRLMQVGIRNIRQRGGGSEFESLREYVEGDEYRKIDWRATARRNKLISRQYEAERAQNIMLVIDTGRNMMQKVHGISKLDYVVNTALMLAYVASSSDDRIGLMVFDADVRIFIPPGKGKTQVYRLLDALYNTSPQMVESDYHGGFKELATRIRRRSLVVLFTDLLDTESSSEMVSALAMLESAHRTLCVTVSDPNIVGAAKSTPETTSEVYGKAVSMQVLQERRQAISLLKRRGIWTIDSPPESLSSDLINHYLTLKARTAI